MKQAQLNNFFNALTEVPESSNNEQKQVLVVEARPASPLQKEPAARHMVLAQARPAAKGLFKNHITHLEGEDSRGREKGTFYLTYIVVK